MSEPLRIPSDMVVQGSLTPRTFAAPASCITNNAIAAGAGIASNKVQRQHTIHHRAVDGTTIATGTWQLHNCKGATGNVLTVGARVTTANIGAATVTIDVKKNGTTILSAVISFGSGDAAGAWKAGTITVPTLAADDILSLVVTATAGGGTLGLGLLVQVDLNEDPQ